MSQVDHYRLRGSNRLPGQQIPFNGTRAGDRYFSKGAGYDRVQGVKAGIRLLYHKAERVTRDLWPDDYLEIVAAKCRSRIGARLFGNCDHRAPGKCHRLTERSACGKSAGNRRTYVAVRRVTLAIWQELIPGSSVAATNWVRGEPRQFLGNQRVCKVVANRPAGHRKGKEAMVNAARLGNLMARVY